MRSQIFFTISNSSLFITLLLFSFGGASFSYGANAKLTEEQIRRLQGEIKTLESQLRQFKGDKKTIGSEIRRTETDAGKLAQSIHKNKRQVSVVTKQLAELNIEQQGLSLARQEQAEVLAQQLAAAYRIGQQDQLKLLLNQQQPERISRILHYYQFLNRSRVETIELYQKTLNSLSAVEESILDQQKLLKSEQSALTNNSEQLQVARRQRVQALKKLKLQISSAGQQLGRLKADRGRLESVLKQLQQTLKKIDLAWESAEFRQLKGKLKWPTKGKVVWGYGSHTPQGIKNDGLLIRAPMGRNVRTVHHGRVVFSDWLRGFGLLIIVDHGSGYMSLYGHNQSLLKEVGDWVSGNEAIATVGDSGGLSKTGLYFAIRYKGQPYNPRSWLSKRQG
ncbi:MAG: peptidoglycan DD-metalloendopeptidase family protein [Motiliproteus sp.]